MQQSELVNSLRQLRDTHRGVSFNPNFASVKIIKRVAENFTSNKRINVETISSVNKYIQYMIASKLVGDRMFYDKLCSYSNHLLDAYCDDIDVVELKFTGSNLELLMLAQGRLFFDREEAEMYIMHCKAIIAVMRAQLPELDDCFDED